MFPSNPKSSDIIDVHCHHLAFSPKNGGYAHPKFANSYQIRWYLNAIGILNKKQAFLEKLPPFEYIDELYRTSLIQEVEQSSLTHAVILAFDGVYDKNGYFDPKKTPESVTNDAVIELCKESPKMLFGASINPLRKDWSDELDKCLEADTVLIKWLPNVMGFDPNDNRLELFYRRLYENKLPILMHVGFEYAMPNIDIRFAGLDRLETALKFGVTVIAAHCCGGDICFDSRRSFNELRCLVEKYPNLYLDVAALASFHRKSRFLNAINDPLISSRLVFGTDYPVPAHPFAFEKEIAERELPENYFDKDIFIKTATNLPHDALARGYEPLKHRLS
jgi:predicted TIM-barrel fold metal-dependent hydrolase